MILEFIAQNWLGLLIAAGALVYIVYLGITKRWTKIREFAYQMMLLAERNLANEDGQMKFDFVVGVVYKYIPVWLRFFVKETDIRSLIQKWYELAKDFMDDGEINDSLKKERT